MLVHEILALLAIVATWGIVGCVSMGMGSWYGRGLCNGRGGAGVMMETFWVGVGTLLGVLQIWHFWGAIDEVAQAVVMGVGMFGFVLMAGRIWRALRGMPRCGLGWGLAVLGVMMVWLANRCTGPGAEYDAGLYHIAAEKWSRLYAIVPGLANLHMRFGFSSTVILMGAWLDHGLWAGEANHFVNGFFLMGLAGMVVRSGTRVWVGRGVAADWLMVFSGLLVVDWGVDIQVGSYSTDIAAMVLSVVAGHYFLRAFAEREGAGQGAGLAVVVTGAAAITVKASALVLCGPMVAMVLLWMGWRSGGRRWRALGPGAMAAGLLIGPWLVRQMILSGYPLYPMELLSVPVDWRVPYEKVRWLRRIMLNWARWSSYADTRGSFAWVGTWMRTRVLDRWTIWRFCIPGVVVIGAAIFAALRAQRLQKTRRELAGLWCLLGCTVVAAVTWYESAPDPRYSSQIFVMMMGCALILAMGPAMFGAARLRKGMLIAASVLALGPLVYGCHEAQRYTGRTLAGLWILPPLEGMFYPTPQGQYTTVRTTAGLTVYVPKAPEGGGGVEFEDRMWDGPLPNAPRSEVEVQEVNIGELRLRREGDVQAGFTRAPAR